MFGWIDKGLYRYGLISPSHLVFPNFIVIGAPKSGTWWLASRIEKHPQVSLGRGKHSGEIKYFSKFFYKPLSYYSSCFSEANSQVRGEKSPNYCRISRSRIRLIRNLMPNVRLILILRNPIDRAWSEALMTLVRDSGKRFSDIPTRVIYNKLDAVTIHYSVVIEKWLEFFSASQLHICFYEQIKQNPEILLRGVFQHIQVGTDIDYEELNMEEVINVGTGIEMPSKYRKHLIDTYRDEIHKMSRLWGAPIQPWLDDISNQAAQ